MRTTTLRRLILGSAMTAMLGLASPPLFAGFGTDTSCVSNRPAGSNCTSNDLTFVLIGLGIQSDGCVNDNDTVTIELGAQIRNTTAQTRYDVGIFIDRNNVSAYAGTNCAVEVIHQPDGSVGPLGNFSCPPLALNDFPTGEGPFLNTDGDACGDLQNEDGAGCDISPVDGFYDDTFIRLEPLTLSCKAGAVTNDGFVRIASCLTWGNNDDQVGSIQGANKQCDGAMPENDVHAGTNAKCRCADSEVSNIPLPNLVLNCDDFNLGGDLEPNETEIFDIDFTNTIPGCTPAAPALDDPFGRFRCGTASFVRIVVDYTSGAETHGVFEYVDENATTQTIPPCPSFGTLDNDAGVVCLDATNHRLVFAPRDSSGNNALGVVSPFAGTRTMSFGFRLTDVNFGQPVNFTSNFYWDDLLDTDSSGIIEEDEALAIAGTSMLQEPCSGCSCSSEATTTPVTLASFRATPDGRQTRFDWSTETEVGNVAFNLFALVGDEQIRLNDAPIPTGGGDSLLPQSYQAWLTVPDGVVGFVVEDLDFRGRAKAHGPFAPGKGYGARAETRELDWQGVRRGHGLDRTEKARGIQPRSRGKGNLKLAAAAPAAPSGASGSIELHVDRDGLYRVAYEDLLAAGFDLASASASQLALTLRGQAVPMHVSTNGKFGPGSYLEFWGEGLDTLYTDTNVYRLATGVKKPARAAISTAAPAGAPPATYPETRRFERNLGYAYYAAEDPFFDTQMLAFGAPLQWSFPLAIDGYLADGSESRLRVEAFGATSFPEHSPDHRLQVLLNGSLLGELEFDGATPADFDGAIPDGVLLEGANTLTLRLPADTGAPFDMIGLEGFEIVHPRTFTAQNGGLAFAGIGSRFDVAGLPSAEAVAYRRDAAGLTRLGGLAVAPDGGGFRAVVPGSGAPAEYRVAATSALLAPARIQAARSTTGLRTGPASYLVIAHAAFVDELGALVAAREGQGHSVKVVDVEDVYAEFAGGVFDPQAIRDYIAHAYGTMGTRHVLLVGGDTYDYHDYLGLAPVSFVPSLYRATHEVVRFAPSDAAYADVDGDGIQDLAIGRFPVRTVAELDGLIAKTLAYDARDYAGVGAAAADFTDPQSSEPFQSVADRLITSFGPAWQFDEVYLDQLALGTARSKLFADIAAGSALTAYLGHSGQISWGSPMVPLNQRLFTVNDVAALGNAGRPTIVMQLGCWNAYYNHPQIESLGNRLVLIEERGAAAVMGATTLTDDANGNRFAKLLAPWLAKPGTTIGEAIWRAKQAVVDQSSPERDLRDILHGWTLLGDPALTVGP